MNDLGTAGSKANIEHFEALRIKYAELALNALADEIKWRTRLEMQVDPVYGISIMTSILADEA